MKCNIVVGPESRGWIIEKMAVRLVESLRRLGVSAEVSAVPSNDADINHFMLYYEAAELGDGSRTTISITHVDDAVRLHLLKDLCRIVRVGICMSSMTRSWLVEQGIDPASLCHVSPAHDGMIRPRRTRIGITTNLYSDGRKREAFLLRLGEDLDLTLFDFRIFGKGWLQVADALRVAGAEVIVDESSSYLTICEQVPSFDYYLYMGMDEGSLGTLDALAAGVPTIVTPQGFHLDIPGGITHPFVTYEDMKEIFLRIVAERQARVESVRELTWEAYAEKHIVIWRAIISGNVEDISQLLHQNDLPSLGTSPARQFSRVSMYFRMMNRSRRWVLWKYYLPFLRKRVWSAWRRFRATDREV